MNRFQLLKNIKSGTTEFSNLDIKGDFYESELTNIKFDRCFFESDLSGTDLVSTVFYKCNLKACIFRFANLNETIFEENLLDSADFSFANFHNSCFINNSSYGIEINNDNCDLLKVDETIGINISNVKSGWYELFIYSKRKHFCMDASDFLGHDGPKELLRAILDLISNELNVNERWVCWHDEPGASIWRLYNKDNLIGIEIYNSIKYSYELRNDDDYLKEQAGKLYFDILVDKMTFVKECLIAFFRIKNKIGIKEYKKAWFPFPEEELENLERYRNSGGSI